MVGRVVLIQYVCWVCALLLLRYLSYSLYLVYSVYNLPLPLYKTGSSLPSISRVPQTPFVTCKLLLVVSQVATRTGVPLAYFQAE
jgi:hypothetical protein